MSKCDKRCIDCIHFDMCVDLHAYYKGVDKEWVKCFMSDGHSDKLECEHYKSKSLCVEVVRCKDCQWWEAHTYGSTVGRCENPRNGLFNEYTEEDDYCSYVERKLKEVENGK